VIDLRSVADLARLALDEAVHRLMGGSISEEPAFAPATCDNESGPGGVGSTDRGLTSTTP
jgi:hypothetical protein